MALLRAVALTAGVAQKRSAGVQPLETRNSMCLCVKWDLKIESECLSAGVGSTELFYAQVGIIKGKHSHGHVLCAYARTHVLILREQKYSLPLCSTNSSVPLSIKRTTLSF